MRASRPTTVFARQERGGWKGASAVARAVHGTSARVQGRGGRAAPAPAPAPAARTSLHGHTRTRTRTRHTINRSVSHTPRDASRRMFRLAGEMPETRANSETCSKMNM